MKIEITRMMTMIAACCFSSVLVLLTAETTFFLPSPSGSAFVSIISIDEALLLLM
jgi:hypothetical protein